MARLVMLLGLVAAGLMVVGCSAGQAVDVSEGLPAEFAATPGVHRGMIEHGGIEREFIVYVPQAALSGERQPLLFVIHGGGGNAGRMRNVGFEPLADRDGGFLVYPEAVDKRWADGRVDMANELAGVDDVGFMDELAELLMGHLAVDEGRVGVTGASNGGMMSHRIACQSRTRLRLAAPVIASLPADLLDQCEPGEAPSLVAIQGTEDLFVNIEGGDVAHERYPNLGEGGAIESAEATMGFWAERLGCAGFAVEELARGRTTAALGRGGSARGGVPSRCANRLGQ